MYVCKILHTKDRANPITLLRGNLSLHGENVIIGLCNSPMIEVIGIVLEKGPRGTRQKKL